jgi:hypothetical protein
MSVDTIVWLDDYLCKQQPDTEDPMTLFRLDSSIRTDGSVSREIADTLQRAYTDRHPQATVLHRDLGTEPIPADVWSAAALGAFTPAEHRTPVQGDAAVLAATLADELLTADAAVIATALFNFGSPSTSRPGSTCSSAIPASGRAPARSPVAR